MRQLGNEATFLPGSVGREQIQTIINMCIKGSNDTSSPQAQVAGTLNISYHLFNSLVHRPCSDCNLEVRSHISARPGNITLKILFRISCGVHCLFFAQDFPGLTHLEFPWTSSGPKGILPPSHQVG